MTLESGNPCISGYLEIKDGYTARDLVLIDGYQGEITMRINTHTRDCSTAAISVWNPTTMAWSQVYAMSGVEVGTFPVSMHPRDKDVRAALQTLADYLHHVAECVLKNSRERQEDLDLERLDYAERTRLEVRQQFTAEVPDCLLGDDAQIDHGHVLNAEPARQEFEEKLSAAVQEGEANANR